MMVQLIKEILAQSPESQDVMVHGWVRTRREMKNLVFVEVNDGSCLAGIQCTFDCTRRGHTEGMSPETNTLPKQQPALQGEVVDCTRRGHTEGMSPETNTLPKQQPALQGEVVDCTQSAGLSAETDTALAALSTGTAVAIKGQLVASPASGQAVEVAASSLQIIGEAPAENRGGERASQETPAYMETPAYLDTPAYPLQKKRHSMEFLREIAHLRPRTNIFGAVARVRNRMAFAIHRYFQERGFQYIHTPIITAGDAEGAGAMFQVTTLEPKAPATQIDYTKDFFGKKTYLTVSGQLEAETYATALSRVYTFGPTFRAENSNTVRHLAEFWMVEPEIAFAELEDDMALAEDFLKFIFKIALDDCAADLAFFDSHIEKGIIETLTHVVNAKFTHINYTDAVGELEKALSNGKAAFEFKPKWGCDLQSEHEKYLTEKVAAGPVIVTDYPKEIKAFYMKQNDDGKTVRAMDVLVPRLGEIIGGSQREEDLEKLCRRMLDMGMNLEDYAWYLDLRRYGTVPHAGFGLGFERLIQYITGMANIRDVIPYPRAVGQAEF